MNRFRLSLTRFNLLKIAIFSLSGLTLSGGVLVFLNWTLLRRALTYPERPITTVDWYKPLEKVTGKPGTLPTATKTEIPLETLKAIATYAQQQNSSALLIMHQGEIILEEYWQGHTATSVTNSMSMSKTIVSLLIGIAIQEGKINSVLDTVATYLPEWSKDDRATITIQDLLYMQSGLRNRDNTEDLRSDLVQMFASEDADRVALKIPAIKPSGEVFEYNNANTQILGILLEKVTEMRYSEYLSTRLWQPLQAGDAILWLDRQRGSPKPFCCLFATARDWAKVGQLLLNRGRVDNTQVVASEWIEKMLTPSTLESTYGLHIWLQARLQNKPEIDKTASTSFLAKDTFYLDGSANQRVYVIPSAELVIVRVGEKPNNWDDSFIPNSLVGSLNRNI